MQRWTRRAFVIGSLAIVTSGCTHGWAGQAPYSLGMRGPGNQVTITLDEPMSADYTVQIASARGIGQVTVAWWSHVAPRQLTFHLALTGLEHFELQWLDTLINVSVNSSNQQIYQGVQKGEAAETMLMADSPFWMEVTLPTEGIHYFTLRTPNAFAQDGPRLLRFAWVDFYR